MIVSVLEFRLRQGAVPDLADTFARHQILETAIKVQGCKTLVLATPDPDGSEAYVLGIWEDETAYQRWMDHPDRGAATEDLLQLVAGEFDPTAPAGRWQVLRFAQGSSMSTEVPGR